LVYQEKSDIVKDDEQKEEKKSSLKIKKNHIVEDANINETFRNEKSVSDETGKPDKMNMMAMVLL